MQGKRAGNRFRRKLAAAAAAAKKIPGELREEATRKSEGSRAGLWRLKD